MSDIAAIEVKDGYMPTNPDFNLLIARFCVSIPIIYYKKLPQLLNGKQWCLPEARIHSDLGYFDQVTIHKLYSLDLHAPSIAACLRALLDQRVITDCVIYYDDLAVTIGNYLPDKVDQIATNDGYILGIGATRDHENSKKPYPANKMTFVPNLSDDRVARVIEMFVLPRLESDDVATVELTKKKERIKTNDRIDDYIENDTALTRVIEESLALDRRSRNILELGIKNFSRNNHTETLCIWCRIEEAQSMAIECEHVLFCRKCFHEYCKSDCAKFCPMCLRDTKIEVWE